MQIAFSFGCAAPTPSNISDMRALASLSSDESDKDKLVEREVKNFEKLNTAIKLKTIAPGMSRHDVIEKYGAPVVVAATTKGTKLVYKHGEGDWFQGPKVHLYFDSEDQLTSVECLNFYCAPRT